MRFILAIIFLVVFLSYDYDNAFSEKTVVIPFGAYNPELNTPAKSWYEPSLISVEIGEKITWINKDNEAHTITSGKGSGRFGWMSNEFGKSDGYFDSDRFMSNESWSFTFDKKGLFGYYCTIHPWMEGAVLVQQEIPNYPTDGLGNKIEKFPVVQFTADKVIETDLTWEPNVIKTHEKIRFIYQFYDALTERNLAKMSYDFVLVQDGKEVYRDTGKTEIGGDFRDYVFDISGPILVRFEKIQGDVRESAEGRTLGGDIQRLEQRTIEFSTIVHGNADKSAHEEFQAKPAQRLGLYYEIMIVIVVVPGILFVYLIFLIKKKPSNTKSSSPI
jgi:plastocyanin